MNKIAILIELNENWFFHLPRIEYCINVENYDVQSIINQAIRKIGIEKYGIIRNNEGVYELSYRIVKSKYNEILNRSFLAILNTGKDKQIIYPSNSHESIEVKSLNIFLQ